MGHALADAETISVRQLERDPLVLLNVDEIAEAAEQACRLAGVRPTVAIRTQSVEAARSLVATGAGVAVLPDLAYRPWSLEGDRIEARDLLESIPPVEVALAWRRGAPLTPVGEQFLALTRSPKPQRTSPNPCPAVPSIRPSWSGGRDAARRTGASSSILASAEPTHLLDGLAFDPAEARMEGLNGFPPPIASRRRSRHWKPSAGTPFCRRAWVERTWRTCSRPHRCSRSHAE
jgi:LysR substrate binding domain